MELTRMYTWLSASRLLWTFILLIASLLLIGCHNLGRMNVQIPGHSPSGSIILRGHTKELVGIAYFPRKRMMATSSIDGTIRIWTLPTGKELHRINVADVELRGIAFSPKGDLLASGSFESGAHLWDPYSGTSIRQLEGTNINVEWLSFSPDGRLIAGASLDGFTKIWEVKTGKLIKTLDGNISVDAAEFSPNYHVVATAGVDSTVKLWNTATWTLKRSLTWDNDHDVLSLAFSPNGKYLAGGCTDMTVKVWNMLDGKMHVLNVQRFNPIYVAFSPDSKTIAVAAEDTVEFYDVGTSKLLNTIKPTAYAFSAIIWCPKDSTLAVAGYNNIAEVWMQSNSSR